MNTINRILLLFSIVSFLSCNKESTSNFQAIELRDNLSSTEFTNAIIGEWQSVFENEAHENVIYLKLDKQGKAKITIVKDGAETEYSGDYTVGFMREPSEGSVTLANINISTSGNEIVLSRVNFGLHNAFPADSGLYLRIDEPPYGVLQRIE